MTTPFTRVFGAIAFGNDGEYLKVMAPTDPSVVLHVKITQQSALPH